MQDGSGQIVAQSLTKRFGPVTAVQNLSFTVPPGTVTGFLGPNGAGKTTALRMVLGLISPTSGHATVNGVAFAELPRPATVVGAVLEAQSFHPSRSARSHLRVYAAAIGVPDSRADQVLALVGLADAAGRGAGGFSLGMRQRLALAVALLGDPQILVLDEPANGLDPEGVAWLRTFLRNFAATGRTVLVSSHILAEVEQTVDQVVIISRGQTIFAGPLADLSRSQSVRVLVRPGDPERMAGALRENGIYNFESTPDGQLAVTGAQSRQIADIALAAGVAVYGIQEERANLESVYLSLTSGQYVGTQPRQFSPMPAAVPTPPPLLPPGYPQPPQPPADQTGGYQPQPYQPQGYQPPTQQGFPPQGYRSQDYQQPYQPQSYQPPQAYQPQGYQPQSGYAQPVPPPAQPDPTADADRTQAVDTWSGQPAAATAAESEPATPPAGETGPADQPPASDQSHDSANHGGGA
jgi:ABC-2 type transport system ATP-binding protein